MHFHTRDNNIACKFLGLAQAFGLLLAEDICQARVAKEPYSDQWSQIGGKCLRTSVISPPMTACSNSTDR